MRKERTSYENEIVTRENLPKLLENIGRTREKTGTSDSLIPLIHHVRDEAEKLGEKNAVLQLLQEEYLVVQHIIMEERTKKFKANPLKVTKAIVIMESVTRTMEKYAKENEDDLNPVLNARVFRFLGRYADLKHQYKKSEVYYRKGLLYFEQSSKTEEKFNRLEFLGFISYSLIKQGKTNDGMELVQQTLKDFDESPEGEWLRENDYFTWAVWKSGIEIRTAEHIIDKNDSKRADVAKDLLQNAQNILKMPNGSTEDFRLRLDELNNIRSKFKTAFHSSK